MLLVLDLLFLDVRIDAFAAAMVWVCLGVSTVVSSFSALFLGSESVPYSLYRDF